MFYKKELQKTSQKVEKVIERKDNKLCVKWKDYDKERIDKKEIV